MTIRDYIKKLKEVSEQSSQGLETHIQHKYKDNILICDSVVKDGSICKISLF